MRKYEAMFLFDPSFASEGDNVEKEIGRLLGRIGGSLIALSRWDERKLAYEIEGRKRGVHVVAFIQAPPEKIRDLERDVQLSEQVLRVLVLKADHLTEEDMKKPVPGPSEFARRPGDGEGRWEGGGREGGGRFGGGERRGGRDRFQRSPQEGATAAAEPDER